MFKKLRDIHDIVSDFKTADNIRFFFIFISKLEWVITAYLCLIIIFFSDIKYQNVYVYSSSNRKRNDMYHHQQIK